MSNPYVFIVGCPRSGTTLLRHMVSAHPQIVVTPEAHWIPLYYEGRRGMTAEGLVTSGMISDLLANPKFSLFRVGESDLRGLVPEEGAVSYADFVSALFDLYGLRMGKQLVGNKTPDSVRRMDTLHSLWPRARFLHLIRDGRDVALSLINWPKVLGKKPGTFPSWKEDPASTAALWWELNVRRGREAGERLGPKLYHEVRYESLVEDPAGACEDVCRFLGVKYDGSMLRWNESDQLPNEGSGSLRAVRAEEDGKKKWQPQPLTRGLRDWRTQMKPEDVERFEAAAGALLSDLGYQRAFPDLRPEAVRHSSEVRSSLAGVGRDVRPYGVD